MLPASSGSATGSVPTCAPTVPIAPVRWPAACRTASRRCTTVVLPFVPVTPIIVRDRDGSSNTTLDIGPIASRTDRTRTCGTSRSSHRSTTSATAPERIASRAWPCPSMFAPDEEERAGGDLAGIEGDLADLDARVAADLGTTHGVGHRGQRHLGKGIHRRPAYRRGTPEPAKRTGRTGIDGSGVRRERRQAHGRCGRDREPLDHVSSDLGEDRGRHAPVDRPRLVDRYRDHHSGIRRGEEPHE